MLFQGEFYCLGFPSATAGDALAIYDDSYLWWDKVRCFMELRRYFHREPWWSEFCMWIPYSVTWPACTLNRFYHYWELLSWRRLSQRPKVSN
jgi:hypothetical protein